MKDHEEEGFGISFSSLNENWLASVGYDGKMIVYDVKN